MCVFSATVPDKTKETYVRMLEYIVEESSMRGISFIPLVFHVDLEFPAHQALLERFPHCQIQLCLFHLGQAWYWNQLQPQVIFFTSPSKNMQQLEITGQ